MKFALAILLAFSLSPFCFGAMETVIPGGDGVSGEEPQTNSVNYSWLTGSGANSWGTVELLKNGVCSRSGTFGKLYVKLDQNPAGGTYTFEIRKNGANSGVQVAITGAATTGNDTTHTIAVTAGDLISLQCTPSGTFTNKSGVMWCSSFIGGTQQGLLMAQTTSTVANGATNYFGIDAETTAGTVETLRRGVIPTGGTISGIYVNSSGSLGGAGKMYDITLLTNGVATAMTVNLNNVQTGNDLTHPVTVNAGDQVSFMSVPTSTPTARQMQVGVQWTPTIDGEAIHLTADVQATTSSATRYQTVSGGQGAWATGETSKQLLVGACTLKKWYAILAVAPGAAAGWTFNVRKNAASPGINFTISDPATTGNNTTSNTVCTAGDLIDYQIAPVVLPASTQVQFGMVYFVQPTTTTDDGDEWFHLLGF